MGSLCIEAVLGGLGKLATPCKSLLKCAKGDQKGLSWLTDHRGPQGPVPITSGAPTSVLRLVGGSTGARMVKGSLIRSKSAVVDVVIRIHKLD